MERLRNTLKQRSAEVDTATRRIRELEDLLADREYELEQSNARGGSGSSAGGKPSQAAEARVRELENASREQRQQLEQAKGRIAELEHALTDKEKSVAEEKTNVKTEADHSDCQQMLDDLSARNRDLEQVFARFNQWALAFERDTGIKFDYDKTIDNVRLEQAQVVALTAQVESSKGMEVPLRQQITNLEMALKKAEKKVETTQKRLDKKIREVVTMRTKENRQKIIDGSPSTPFGSSTTSPFPSPSKVFFSSPNGRDDVDDDEPDTIKVGRNGGSSLPQTPVQSRRG